MTTQQQKFQKLHCQTPMASHEDKQINPPKKVHATSYIKPPLRL
jgi:hypothetical protein